MNAIPAIPRPVTIAPHNLDCVLTGAEGIGSIIDGEVISSGMLSHTRILEDGSLLVFLCNMGGKIYDGELRVKGGPVRQRFDPEDGSCARPGDAGPGRRWSGGYPPASLRRLCIPGGERVISF